MTTSLLGNPHSLSPSSQLSTLRIEDTRLRALRFFHADPAEFDLIFVANATAGIKLVVEALRAVPGGFDYVYHQSSHTSLVGVREEAAISSCVSTDQVENWLEGSDPFQDDERHSAILLFAYPGQSNLDGRRYPFTWPPRLRKLNLRPGGSFYTLLDAAALAATYPLDLSDSETAPDFTVVSFSKIFGFPDLGALIVRRQAESAFTFRRYFGGGTVETVVCQKEQWHAPKSHRLHERLEDGTLPVHSIIALDSAMSVHGRLFGSMANVASHVSYLAGRLYAGLQELRHCNKSPVCEIYSPGPEEVLPAVTGSLAPYFAGPIIAFNLRNHAGAYISLTEIEKLAGLKNIHIRTGGVCNPGGVASALDLQPWEIKRNFSAGFRCGSENDVIAGKPTGVIRASIGAMSTVSDVDAFVAFVSEFYREKALAFERPDADEAFENPNHSLYVSDIIVYPVKSCGGFAIPKDTGWEVRPEGLAWDREWCLLHQGTGQALSQKRYANMALLRPVLDFEAGFLRITYAGKCESEHQPKEIRVPLSSNPALFHASPMPRGTRSSRVCGEEIFALTYASEAINTFFSATLGVPCVLARFPPGGQEGDKSARHAKAHLQKHQRAYCNNNAAIPLATELSRTPPSPPDSDAEEIERRRILLSNESPILAINMASVRALNKAIVSRGGRAVSSAVFRANIILDTLPKTLTRIAPEHDSKEVESAYAEDNWSSIRVGGQQTFKMLGSCRRCHMVCINQSTGEKGEEPFVTLSKTRRFDGKVFFGTHMCHVPSDSQNPTVKVGDHVKVVS